MNIRQIKAWVLQQITNLGGRWARIAASSSIRRYELEGRAGGTGEEGDDEEPYQDSAVLYQQYGFRSRPAPGSDSISVACGGSSQRVILATETPGAGPTDQVDGEVEVYSSTGQRIRLMHDGGVRIESGAGAIAWLKADGSIQLSTGTGGGVATLSGARWTVQDEIATHHTYVTGAPPIVGALVGGVVALVTGGADGCFTMTLTVAPNPLAGDICLVTYSSSWGSPPLVSISGGGPVSFSASPTATNLKIGASALPVGVYTLTITSVGKV